MGLFSSTGRQRFCSAQVKDAQTGQVRNCQNPVSGSAKGCFQHPTGTSSFQPAVTRVPPARVEDQYGKGHVMAAPTIDFEDVGAGHVRGSREYIAQLEFDRDELWAERESYAATCASCDATVYPNQGCFEHGNAPGNTWTATERREFDHILGDFQRHSAVLHAEIRAFDESHPEEVAARQVRVTEAVAAWRTQPTTPAQDEAIAAFQDRLRAQGVAISV